MASGAVGFALEQHLPSRRCRGEGRKVWIRFGPERFRVCQQVVDL